jgi:hypothetical protein
VLTSAPYTRPLTPSPYEGGITGVGYDIQSPSKSQRPQVALRHAGAGHSRFVGQDCAMTTEAREREVWIGLVEVRAEEGNAVFDGSLGPTPTSWRSLIPWRTT